MERIDSLANAVRRKWEEEGVAGPFIREKDIQRVELKLGALPDIYRRFIILTGQQNDCDSEGFLFWPPDQLDFANSTLLGYKLEAPNSIIIIADCLQEAWLYGLWVTGKDAGKISVIFGYENAPQTTISSFDGFIEKYLINAAEIYGKKSV
jgi:hypothetical protein